jgi:hypothetical protein
MATEIGKKLRRAGLANVPVVRIDYLVMLGRALAAGGHRRKVARVVGALKRESRPDGPAHAMVLRAACLSSDRRRAMAALHDARTRFEGCDMALDIALVDAAMGRSGAHDRIRASGITAPARWQMIYLPTSEEQRQMVTQ